MRMSEERLINPTFALPRQRSGVPRGRLGNRVPKWNSPGAGEANSACATFSVLLEQDARAAPPALAEVSAGQLRR
jgi:hypothetical protein